MTLNLSEAKNHGCRLHRRGSVRRASGFVLTSDSELTAQETQSRIVETREMRTHTLAT